MTEIVEAQHKTILDMDATELAQKIRDREITCTEAVSDYIKQITKINPRINAMAEERFTQAIEEAKEKDLQLNESTAKGDLFGVPISVKEAYDVAGMKTTGGLLYRRKAFASEDAEVVKRLKNAGAIILGKTNTPELCFCQETENKLYGRTNNPWDIARTAGGSSGGEGSLLAAGGAAIGIGSDIGGSIRFPSHFNGVIGFKSGMFQVSADGNFPNINHPLQQRMLGLGPMGKSVRDMKRMYHIIADRKPAAKTLDSVQIDILPAATNFPLAKYSKELLDDVAHFLSSFFPIERAVPPYFNDSALLWQEIMSIDGGKSVAEIALPNQNTTVWKEYAKERFTNISPIHRYLSWALIGANMFKPSKRRIAEIVAIFEKGDAKLHDYLANRVLIFPVYHRGAPEHGEVYKDIFSIRKTFKKYMPFIAHANVWGLPALVIPVGTDEDHMPISIQIMSMNGNEDLLFKLGEMLETHFRGYARSQLLD